MRGEIRANDGKSAINNIVVIMVFDGVYDPLTYRFSNRTDIIRRKTLQQSKQKDVPFLVAIVKAKMPLRLKRTESSIIVFLPKS